MQAITNTIDQVIDDVVAANVSDTHGFDEIVWGPVDGANLKTFDKNLGYTGIKPNFYDFYDKDPYDIYKIFVTDEIIDYMVDQTNLYVQQIGPIRRSKTKSWVPTNHNEMETFIGILLWMGLFKLPKLRNYWSKNFLYENNISKTMTRNRFEQLLKMWHFNDNNDESYANDRLRKISPLIKKTKPKV
ncbi:hypothetical protein NQ314_001227 [Rhamnusium bicolor]|uniref:PiggyBac transposable element-derived protein domain-containing protein n=1 Tax=Rhamnusium bicolor TaxID=1586634 RepID=A0AAV8ZTT5_9CUCU|nr:hypothetical protein NQ314_001227 [Rhamnusium bicolor]